MGDFRSLKEVTGKFDCLFCAEMLTGEQYNGKESGVRPHVKGNAGVEQREESIKDLVFLFAYPL